MDVCVRTALCAACTNGIVLTWYQMPAHFAQSNSSSIKQLLRRKATRFPMPHPLLVQILILQTRHYEFYTIRCCRGQARSPAASAISMPS